MSATSEFIKADFGGTLFPLKTNLLMAENHEAEMTEYIYQKVLDEQNKTENFLSQQRVHATKPRGHLRRTVKLDPVAEFFLYDLTYRNRAIFRPEVSEMRRSFGYRFKNGVHITVHSAYGEYQQCLVENDAKYGHKLQFDIASYFNSLYHHDISHWFAAGNAVSEVDSKAFGQFLREINAGRSVDFLPQGIYPSKMIGNEFLKFVDLSAQLKSARVVRFMDDFTLFDNDAGVLLQDFVRIQQLLGQYALNVNPSKTHFDKSLGGVEKNLSELHESLKEIVDEIKEIHYASTVEFLEVETEIESKLTSEQVSALLGLLKDESLEESDADKILGFLRSHSDSILDLIPGLLRRFPNLIKHIYSVCGTITEKPALAAALLEYLEKENFFLEFQLFWLACIVEDHLLGEGCYGELLMKLYERTQDFKIARAKVLEIPEQGFGFKEVRGEYLKTGQSDWLSWASAMGSRTLKSAERNYVLDYFSKGSPMNFLIAGCARKF
jgi:hypothetical protein